MREIAELRVDEQFAPLLFGESEGKRLGNLVRKVEIDTSDPRFVEVGRLQKVLLAEMGKPFFYGWKIKRKYNDAEIKKAELFLLNIRAVFEPAGEECGTKYDGSTACPCCGSGAKQDGPLRLDARRIPNGKDFAKTIAGEIVVSQTVADLFERYSIKGLSINHIYNRSNAPIPVDTVGGNFRQLIVEAATARIVSPTRIGIDPFDDDEKKEYRCSLGDLIGLNLLSEVWASVSTTTSDSLDVFSSYQYVGVKRGLLRPERAIFVSQKIYNLIKHENLKGCDVEIAHFV